MKTLKNKIFAGAFVLASLGFFGEKNLTAQNVAVIGQDTLRCSCSETQGKNRKEIPCFNRDKNPEELQCILGDWNVSFTYSEMKEEKGMQIYVLNTLQIEDFNGKEIKDIKYPKKGVFERFNVYYDSKLIDYAVSKDIIDSVKVNKRYSWTYTKKNLTKKEIYERFGKDFAERFKEIINAQNDSTKLINLAKKEYKRWRVLEDENGERFELNPLIISY